MKQIINKYKSVSINAKATLCFFICNVLQKGIQYVTLPVFSRILSIEEYGEYIVFLSWLSVIQIFATLNLSAGIFMTGMAKYEQERNQYTTNMMGLSISFTVFVGILYVIFYKPLCYLIDLSPVLIILIFVQSLFAPCFLFWSVHERYELRYRELVVVTVVGSLASPIISMFLIMSISDKALALCSGYISGQVCMGIYCGLKILRRNKQIYNTVKWKEALIFNIPLIPHYLSYVVLGQADRVMINNICGQYDAGIYGLAYQLSNAMNMLTTALDSAYSPQIYMEIKKQTNNGKVKLSINNMLVFYSMALAGMALIAPEILLIFGSEKYIAAKWVMPAIILSSYFLFIAGLFMKVEFYFKKNIFITTASTFIALINILLNYIFINKYGYIAAAYTTLFCYTAFACVHFILMYITFKKHSMKNSIFDYKFILGLSIALFISVAAVLELYNLNFLFR